MIGDAQRTWDDMSISSDEYAQIRLSKDGGGDKGVVVSWEVVGGYPYLSRRGTNRGAGC